MANYNFHPNLYAQSGNGPVPFYGNGAPSVSSPTMPRYDYDSLHFDSTVTLTGSSWGPIAVEYEQPTASQAHPMATSQFPIFSGQPASEPLEALGRKQRTELEDSRDTKRMRMEPQQPKFGPPTNENSITRQQKPFSSAIYGQAPMLGFPQPAAGYANSSTIRHSRGAEDSDLARHQVPMSRARNAALSCQMATAPRYRQAPFDVNTANGHRVQSANFLFPAPPAAFGNAGRVGAFPSNWGFADMGPYSYVPALEDNSVSAPPAAGSRSVSGGLSVSPEGETFTSGLWSQASSLRQGSQFSSGATPQTGASSYIDYTFPSALYQHQPGAGIFLGTTPENAIFIEDDDQAPVPQEVIVVEDDKEVTAARPEGPPKLFQKKQNLREMEEIYKDPQRKDYFKSQFKDGKAHSLQKFTDTYAWQAVGRQARPNPGFSVKIENYKHVKTPGKYPCYHQGRDKLQNCLRYKCRHGDCCKVGVGRKAVVDWMRKGEESYMKNYPASTYQCIYYKGKKHRSVAALQPETEEEATPNPSDEASHFHSKSPTVQPESRRESFHQPERIQSPAADAVTPVESRADGAVPEGSELVSEDDEEASDVDTPLRPNTDGSTLEDSRWELEITDGEEESLQSAERLRVERSAATAPTANVLAPASQNTAGVLGFSQEADAYLDQTDPSRANYLCAHRSWQPDDKCLQLLCSHQCCTEGMTLSTKVRAIKKKVKDAQKKVQEAAKAQSVAVLEEQQAEVAGETQMGNQSSAGIVEEPEFDLEAELRDSYEEDEVATEGEREVSQNEETLAHSDRPTGGVKEPDNDFDLDSLFWDN